MKHRHVYYMLLATGHSPVQAIGLISAARRHCRLCNDAIRAAHHMHRALQRLDW